MRQAIDARPFDPVTQCGGHVKRCPKHDVPWGKTTSDGTVCDHAHQVKACRDEAHRCRQYKGFRTTHPGTSTCWLHGGDSPGGKVAGMREAAENALAALGVPEQLDPVASLFEAVRVAAWREQGLRRLLVVRPRLFSPDHAGDDREDVVSAMHDRALKRRAEVAKMAIDAGLDERIVRLAEAQGEVIHRILTAALDAAGVAGDARTRAEEAVVRELVAVGPGADGLN